MRKNCGGRQTTQLSVPVQEIKASKPLTVKICWSYRRRRNSQPPRRVHWRDPWGPKMYMKPTTWESAPEGPNLLVGSRGSAWKPEESLASSRPLSDPSCTYSTTMQWRRLPPSGKYLKLCPLQYNRCAETKKNGQSEGTDQNSKKELSNEEIDNLSDTEFKTLVIRMLAELVEYHHKIETKVKAMQSEIKKNIQGSSSEWKETGNQINVGFGPEGRNKHTTRTEWWNK